MSEWNVCWRQYHSALCKHTVVNRLDLEACQVSSSEGVNARTNSRNIQALILSGSCLHSTLMSGRNTVFSVCLSLNMNTQTYCSIHKRIQTHTYTHVRGTTQKHKHTSSDVEPLRKQLQHLSIPTTVTVLGTLRQQKTTSPAIIRPHHCLTSVSESVKEKWHKWKWWLLVWGQIYCPLVTSEKQSTADQVKVTTYRYTWVNIFSFVLFYYLL